MKKLIATAFLLGFSLTGCIDILDNSVGPVENNTPVAIPKPYETLIPIITADAPPSYQVTLETGYPKDNYNGTYTWLWKIVNTNPGNGKNGTTQNLSHWDLVAPECLVQTDLVTAATGTDPNALTTFIPSISSDNSNDCTTGLTQLIKFNEGTNGSTPTYYSLTISKNLSVSTDAVLYYKSGINTKCGTMTFPGISCSTTTLICTNETAFGGNTKGGGTAWFYFYSNDGSEQSLYAGNKEMVGGKVVVSSDGTITITLGQDWSLQSGTETVKIQGYDNLPTSRPAAGLFTTYKGNELTVGGLGNYSYYIIHLDVQHCQ